MTKLTSHLPAIFVAFILAVAPCGAAAEAESFLGSWELDPVASVADLDGLARWSSASEADREKLRASLEKRAGEMGLELTEETLTLRSGSREVTSSCSARYRNQSIVLLSCSTNDAPFMITVARLSGNRIKVLSSGTDDMDVYVWRRRD